MKIKSFPNPEEFVIKDVVISNTLCKLVFPKTLKVKWTDENKIFRSSLWTHDGKLVSASYKKFTNLGETPDFEPLDEQGMLEYIFKVDGSTLCISKFKNTLIIRTRGTADASHLDNGNEIPFLKEKYPILFDNKLLDSENYSIICEWYSPKNIIIEKEATEPTLWLTGIINHDDYSYAKQSQLDDWAKLFQVARPRAYKFTNISSMIKEVKPWQKGEGIVIYGNNGQVLKKVKADRYLRLHKLSSQLGNINGLLDLYIDKGLPKKETFKSIIETEFDFEIAQSLQSNIDSVCFAGEAHKKRMDYIRLVVHDLRSLPTRKEMAEHIKNTFGKDSSYAFSILDGKLLTRDQILNALRQNING